MQYFLFCLASHCTPSNRFDCIVLACQKHAKKYTKRHLNLTQYNHIGKFLGYKDFVWSRETTPNQVTLVFNKDFVLAITEYISIQ